MAYQALYRKWRPGRFEDVKGQDHIVATLKNQIEMNRVGHAYLFCGTRGTGKTSIAKIFAKAVNCENPIDGSPCNECAMCRAVNEQRSMNVIEIDAASNNGVDSIREIRDEVAYSPSEGQYKVYIIDEVHMLSIGAFNALLKTLEEPPSYVIFILATTEAHKIPITILSRCQRYDFRRITSDVIAARLQELAEAEGIDAEPAAINYVARMGDGSMRDALSLLDQCVAFYIGQTLRYENVLEVLGAVDTAVFGRMLGYILAQDTVAIIELVNEIMIQGRDLTQFVVDFTWYMRNMLMVKSSDELSDLVEMSEEQFQRMKAESENIDAQTLMRFIRIFSDLSGQIRYAAQKRVLVEVALIKLCQPAMERNYDSLIQRIAVLEHKIEKGLIAAPRQADTAEISAGAEATETATDSVSTITAAAMSEDIQMIINRWQQMKSDLPDSMKEFLENVRISEDQNHQLVLGFSGDLPYAYFMRGTHREDLAKVLSQRVGKQVEISVVRLQTDSADMNNFIDPAIAFKGIDIEYED